MVAGHGFVSEPVRDCNVLDETIMNVQKFRLLA